MNVPRKAFAALLVLLVTFASISVYYYSLTQQAESSRTRDLNPVEIYAKSSRSVVTIQGVQIYTDTIYGRSGSIVIGSGFVIENSNSFYIVTNYHVVDRLINMTVTFWDGDAYEGEVIGFDAYSDLAIVSASAPADEFYPLQFAASSSLKVGEAVVAIGNPYGFSGSITVGIVSQLGRTIESQSNVGNFPIADVVQFSAAINPGNSGGPLLNAAGMIVGMTTALIRGSQGIGFAIPSDTITRELPHLIKTGGYDKHPFFGVQLVDMNYQLSRIIVSNLTYGLLIQRILPDSPASKAGLKGGTQVIDLDGQKYMIGGDIIVSVDGNRIVNYDAFSTYLERYTQPGQKIQVGIVRAGNSMVVEVVLEARPSQL